jgi:hypothetical protein
VSSFAGTPPPPPPLAAPPWPIASYDAGAFDATLLGVYRAARAVRAEFQRARLVHARTMGLLIIVIGLSNSAVYSVVGGPPAPAMLDWAVYFDYVLVAVGIAYILFAPRLQAWGVRRAQRRGRLPDLDPGSVHPSLEEAVRVYGRLRQEWDSGLGPLEWLIVATVLLGVILLDAALILSTLWLDFAHPSANIIFLGSPVLFFGIVVPGAVAISLWTRTNVQRIEVLGSFVRDAERRFQSLEWSFYQRY